MMSDSIGYFVRVQYFSNMINDQFVRCACNIIISMISYSYRYGVREEIEDNFIEITTY